MKKNAAVLVFCAVICAAAIQAEEFYPSGVDMFPSLFSPRLLGEGAFITQEGGAQEMAVNPASAGAAQRIVFDAGYAAILGLGGEAGLGHVINAGALFPTRFAVFSASARLISSPTAFFLNKETGFLINASAAKELYPGLSIGLGFNLGAGSVGFSTISGDLGFRYNMGKVGFAENFTWAITARAMGLSFAPSPFTFIAGASADMLHIRAKEAGKASPLVLKGLADIGFSIAPNFFVQAGLSALIADIVSLSVSWGINARETADYDVRKPILSMVSAGIGVHFALKSTGERIAGGRLPTDGDITVSGGFKPLYNNFYAMGGGVSWAVGVRDKTPPVISVNYPETLYISPNNDGVQDALEFPVSITDQRYVTGWSMEVYDEAGGLVRTYRNKETRLETLTFWDVVKRLREVKGGVAVPETFRWDGAAEDGTTAPDGNYYFVIKANDDNDNAAESPRYMAVVDNTPPAAAISAATLSAERIFSPDGDGSKDTFVIELSGTTEDKWEGGFYDAGGNKVKSVIFENSAPSRYEWDGREDAGAYVEDGVYAFRLYAQDRAGNKGEAEFTNIVVSTIKPAVHLTLSDAYLSPNNDGVKDTLRFLFDVPVREGLIGWKLEVTGGGAVVRTSSGTSPVPLNLEFDGQGDNRGVLPEGAYKARLAVTYRNGYVSEDVSPEFYIDLTPPSVEVSAAYEAFSPNNDGRQDEMSITQKGSDEVLWTGIVRNAESQTAAPVRTVRFSGVPPAQWVWDGHTDSGSLAPDGRYIYELSAQDRAGNSGRAQTRAFALSTADTSVMLSADQRAFSPNGDRVKDTINLLPQVKTREGITSWRLDVLNSQNQVVRTVTGTAQIPASIPWDGKTDGGAASPDGQYTARLSLVYNQGDRPEAQTRPFTLDTVAPDGTVNPAYTLFSPNGDGRRDTLPLGITTRGNDTWEASITDAQGKTLKSWGWTGNAPALDWDGADENGNSAANGVYRFALTSTDEAGNTTRREVSGITLDARVPRVLFTESATAIAPKAGAPASLASVTFSPSLSFTDGIESWEFALKDSAGNAVKTFSNKTENRAAPGQSIVWDGKDNAGVLKEGIYSPSLTVIWTKGDVANAAAAPITVDVSGPALQFVTAPEFFSPDNDGVDDELFISLAMEDISPIASWSIEIREPQTNRVFHKLEGKGKPAGRLLWDGRGNVRGGELVQAASDYPYTFSAVDTLGNSSSLDGIIGIDVLVIRDGDNLKIAVPSIQFRSNAADFDGLDPQVVSTNNRVLSRIAQILNKFRDYKVTVEGHANPTTQPGAARDREESTELVPLSEKRAQAVVDILAKNGVQRSRLSSIGLGGKRTVARWDDDDNKWKNRRVEFILIK